MRNDLTIAAFVETRVVWKATALELRWKTWARHIAWSYVVLAALLSMRNVEGLSTVQLGAADVNRNNLIEATLLSLRIVLQSTTLENCWACETWHRSWNDLIVTASLSTWDIVRLSTQKLGTKTPATNYLTKATFASSCVKEKTTTLKPWKSWTWDISWRYSVVTASLSAWNIEGQSTRQFGASISDAQNLTVATFVNH